MCSVRKHVNVFLGEAGWCMGNRAVGRAAAHGHADGGRSEASDHDIRQRTRRGAWKLELESGPVCSVRRHLAHSCDGANDRRPWKNLCESARPSSGVRMSIRGLVRLRLTLKLGNAPISCSGLLVGPVSLEAPFSAMANISPNCPSARQTNVLICMYRPNSLWLPAFLLQTQCQRSTMGIMSPFHYRYPARRRSFAVHGQMRYRMRWATIS